MTTEYKTQKLSVTIAPCLMNKWDESLKANIKVPAISVMSDLGGNQYPEDWSAKQIADFVNFPGMTAEGKKHLIFSIQTCKQQHGPMRTEIEYYDDSEFWG